MKLKNQTKETFSWLPRYGLENFDKIKKEVRNSIISNKPSEVGEDFSKETIAAIRKRLVKSKAQKPQDKTSE